MHVVIRFVASVIFLNVALLLYFVTCYLLSFWTMRGSVAPGHIVPSCKVIPIRRQRVC